MDISSFGSSTRGESDLGTVVTDPDTSAARQLTEDCLYNIPYIMPGLTRISRKKNKQDFLFEFHSNSTRFGKAKKKTSAGYVFYEHWVDNTLHKDSDALNKCAGCNLSIKNPQSVDNSSCIIRTKLANVWAIGKVRKRNCNSNQDHSCIQTPLPTAQYYKPKTEKRNNYEHQMDLAAIRDRDVELIHRAVDNHIIQDELVHAWNEFKTRELASEDTEDTHITIYTDSSLTKDKHHTETKMGYGWTTFEEHKIQHFGKIEQWPSSTRAELAAI